MSEGKRAVAINQTISYGFSSSMADSSAGAHLKLATAIREARYPYFFVFGIKKFEVSQVVLG